MKSIEFYDLVRPAQERFVAATRASLAPLPLAVSLAQGFVGAKWFAASASGVVVTALFAAWGYGELNSSAAISSGWHAAVYCAGFAASFACLTRGLALRDRALSLPFQRGLYLFPSGVVRATSAQLQVHSLHDLRTVEAANNRLHLEFEDGHTFEFPAQNQAVADEAKALVQEARCRLDEATAAQSVRHLSTLDPFCYTDHPSPVSRNVPFQRPTSLWSAALLAVAAVAGTALGVGLWKVRNTLSERVLNETARELNNVGAYESYLARGGTNRDVVDELLPRAELQEARKRGTVEAVEHYRQAHPNSHIAEEIERALRSALLAALDRAKAAGTLEALDAYAKQYPRHLPVAPELAQARHAVYAAAASKAAEAATTSKRSRRDAAGFFRRLVDYAEKGSGEVEVRFRGQLGKSAQGADVIVRRSRYFGGNITLPRRHFRGRRMRRREEMTGAELIAVLQGLFPKEIVAFSLGAALGELEPDDPDRTLPEVQKPTLFIHHRTELSGGTVSLEPRGIFMGAGIFFETNFVIPGEPTRLSHKITTWQTPSRKVLKTPSRTTSDVYEHLARRSFSQFLDKYLRLLLKSPPETALPELPLLTQQP